RVGGLPQDVIDALGFGLLVGGKGGTVHTSPPDGVDFDLPAIVRTTPPKIHQLLRRSPPAALFRGSTLQSHLRGAITSPGGVVAEATGAGHLGKITSRVSAPNPESLK